jgi:hypothetical protein
MAKTGEAVNRDDLIVVPRWDKFQHYKDRNPTWIKLYTELETKDEWLDLTYAQRGMLVTIWCAYATHRGRLRVRNLTIGGAQRRSYVHLQALSDAGWIQVRASTRFKEGNGDASAPGEGTEPNPEIEAMLNAQLEAWAKTGKPRRTSRRRVT